MSDRLYCKSCGSWYDDVDDVHICVGELEPQHVCCNCARADAEHEAQLDAMAFDCDADRSHRNSLAHLEVCKRSDCPIRLQRKKERKDPYYKGLWPDDANVTSKSSLRCHICGDPVDDPAHPAHEVCLLRRDLSRERGLRIKAQAELDKRKANPHDYCW